MATVLPDGIFRLKSSKMAWFGREGYMNLTPLNSMAPETRASFSPASDKGSIGECLSMVAKIRVAAAAACATAAMKGAEWPRSTPAMPLVKSTVIRLLTEV